MIPSTRVCQAVGHQFGTGDHWLVVNPIDVLATDPPHGRVLDVACGRGRNALRLAEEGYRVDAVDISAVAIARARSEARRRDLNVTWHVVDLDDYIPEDGAYQLITVIRYRNRALRPS